MHSLRDFAKGESFLSILMEELVKFCPVALHLKSLWILQPAGQRSEQMEEAVNVYLYCSKATGREVYNNLSLKNQHKYPTLYYYDYYFLEFPKVKRFIITTSSHCEEATVHCYLSRMSIPKTIFNAEFEQKLCSHKNLIEPTAGDVT